MSFSLLYSFHNSVSVIFGNFCFWLAGVFFRDVRFRISNPTEPVTILNWFHF